MYVVFTAILRDEGIPKAKGLAAFHWRVLRKIQREGKQGWKGESMLARLTQVHTEYVADKIEWRRFVCHVFYL